MIELEEEMTVSDLAKKLKTNPSKLQLKLHRSIPCPYLLQYVAHFMLG